MRNQLLQPVLLLLITVLCLTMHVTADEFYLDHYYVPPPDTDTEDVEKSAYEKRYPLPEHTVRTWAAKPMPTFTVPATHVQKQRMEQMPSHIVAVGVQADVEAAALFDTPFSKANEYVRLAAIKSPGAHALRLNVDLMGLREHDSLWLLDANGEAAFGPFNATTGRGWLPPTMGDTVVLALCSSTDTLPVLMLHQVSHFHRPIIKKQLPCNIPIGQEANTKAQEISAGVGRLLVAYESGQQGLCTATLINSHQRTEGLPKPYVLSAWHCFGNAVDYDSVTIFWDYRRANNGNASAPSLYELSFNLGATLVAHNPVLDSVFLELSRSVPIGAYGRAWAGWDARAPEFGVPVQVIHHPMGADMKTSRGRVTKAEVEVCMGAFCEPRYEKQIEALWSAGVTEAGSSGSALLLRNGNYRLVGVLSNGTQHSCTDTSNNIDNFGPFHVFFPEIGCHLVSGVDCHDPYESDSRRCFLLRRTKLSPDTIHNLRRFRDDVLGKTPLGVHLSQEYYSHTPRLENMFSNSAAFRILTEAAVILGAAWGASL